jgi:hypothetical protein
MVGWPPHAQISPLSCLVGRFLIITVDVCSVRMYTQILVPTLRALVTSVIVPVPFRPIFRSEEKKACFALDPSSSSFAVPTRSESLGNKVRRFYLFCHPSGCYSYSACVFLSFFLHGILLFDHVDGNNEMPAYGVRFFQLNQRIKLARAKQ